MPNGSMRRPSRVCAALCASVLASVALVPSSGSADPKPSLEEVRRQVDRLHHEAEQASERLNAVRERLEAIRERITDVRAEVTSQRASVDDLRAQVATVAVSQFQGGDLGTTAQLLTSDDPDQFLSSLATVRSVHLDQAALLTRYIQHRRLLGARVAQLRASAELVAQVRQRAATEKVRLDRKAGAAEALLDRLKEKQRRQLLRQQRREERAAARASRSAAQSRPDTTTTSAAPAPAPVSVPSSGGAAQAVAFALAQVGDAYVYGAAGPDAWDCSGLTMAAWASAGVSLPHASSMQYGYGTPVSTSALAPGDLVFYYSPISHVGLYIGNGQLVHASQPGVPVQVVPVDSMPIAGAVRPG